MNSRYFIFVVGIITAACSGQNREGPLVTCKDLDNGATNACEQGIIASCMSGEITYRVCDEENTCDQDWQRPGKFRCAQTERLSDGSNRAADAGAESGAGGGSAGSGGASGAESAGSGASNAGAGGVGDAGASGTGSTEPCSPDQACTIATTSSGYGIRGLAVVGSDVYLVDGCGAVKKVPKAGGLLTDVAAPHPGGACLNTSASIAATDTHLVVSSPADDILRVFNLADSTIEQTYPSISSGVAADGAAAYWGRTEDLQRYLSPTGTLETFADGKFSGTDITLGGTDLFWLSSDRSSLHRLPKNAGMNDMPSSIDLGSAGATEIAADGSAVYFINSNQVGRVDASGTVSNVVAARQPTHLAVNTTHVYWTDATGLHAIPQAGGSEVLIDEPPSGTYEANAIFADDQFVFVGAGEELRRVPAIP